MILLKSDTTIRDFIKRAFSEVGIEIVFEGDGLLEKGIIASVDATKFITAVGEEQFVSIAKRIGEVVVGVDPTYFRPTEVEMLIGDSSKARNCLNWEPEYDWIKLCKEMVANDLILMKKEEYLRDGGYGVVNYFE